MQAQATALIQRALAPMPRADLPFRLSGTLKRTPADFVVEELPAYAPSGVGEHVYLWLEKRGVSHFSLVAALAAAFDVAADDIGVAGMKDACAITRQFVSLPASAQAALDGSADAALRAQNIFVHARARHEHKLKTGHLHGNRFDVTIGEARTAGGTLAEAVAALVAHTSGAGLINAFGSQRFGTGGATVRLGLGVLGAAGVPRAGRLGKAKLRLALSAVQSALFNVFVAERLAAGTLYAPRVGDVAVVCASGGPFVVDDECEVRARVAAREVVLGGPLYGSKMREAQGPALAHEQELLARFGLSYEMLRPFAKLVRGARRACVVWPGELEASVTGEAEVRVRFSLPSGSYATELLAEWLVPPVGPVPVRALAAESAAAKSPPG
jgi:tRNA pseudouridine13 synthase